MKWWLHLVCLPAIAGPGIGVAQVSPASEQDRPGYVLVVHGGGGVPPAQEMSPELEEGYREGLLAAVERGREVLQRGGSSLDAVEAAIRVMEDDSLFNAGRGSAFNHEGYHELDASIMDGATLDAGGVAGIQRARNPISVARGVMERTPHVLMAGPGADHFAREAGFELVPQHYYFTQRRWDALHERLRQETPYGEEPAQPRGGPDIEPFGTVGAVALDREGNLAAGTSTGGRVNKLPGRVGDSPIIGAGTYASNEGAAVSSTGLGEFVLRVLTTKMVSDLVEREGLSVQEAVEEGVASVGRMGGDINLIAIDRTGAIGIEYTGGGLYRAYVREGEEPRVLIWER